MSIAFKKCETLLCIPFLLTTLYVDKFLLYVVKSNYFVVHYLMLPQTLINSVYGFSMHSVISRIAAALGGVPKLGSAPQRVPDPALCFFSIPISPQPDVVMSHFPSAVWYKCSFQGLAPQPGNPPALT